jgi:thioredoxin-like negative regulator of GroEL
MYVGRNGVLALAVVATVLLLAGLMPAYLFKSAPIPNEAEFHWVNAQEAIAAREFPQALAHLTSCLQSCPFNVETHFLMARTCRRAGRLQDWKTHLEQAAVLRWPRTQINLEQQLQRAQVGDLWQVEDALMDRLNRRPPEQVVILEALVNGLMVNDRLVDVLEITTTWIEEFPEDWVPLIYRGNARLRLNGKTDEVIQDFRRVLELKPDDAEAHLSLAMVLANNGDVRGALPHFQASSGRLSEDPRVLFGLAYCQHSLGQSSEARTTLRQLFAANKDHAAGFFLQAKIEVVEEHPEPAYAWLKKADNLAPKEVDVTNALMQVCRQLGKIQEADKYQRLLEEIRARDAELDRLVTALKSRPEDAALRFQLGMACIKLGRNTEATHWFQGILWKDPGHLPTLNALADFYEKNGNPKMADHYRRKVESAHRQGVANTPEGSPRKKILERD